MIKVSNDPMSIYYQLMLMNGGSYVFQIAAKMGFIQAFAGGKSLSAEELAKTLGYQVRPSFLILESLESLGLLKRERKKEKIKDVFSLSEVAAFLTGNYQNLSAEYWEHLPTLLKEGTPFKKMDSIQDSENEYQVQVKSLEWMLGPTAKLAADLYFKNSQKNDLTILDVGAGSGVWSFAMILASSNSNATLADWPAVLEVAKASSKRHGIEERVSYIEGNFHETEWPKNKFDVCALGNVTHILNQELNQSLFKKIASTLKEDGELIIYDVFSKREEGGLARALYKLGLCIRTVEGEVFEPEEMEPWLKDAGFKEFNFQSLDVEPYSVGAFIAKK